MTTPNITAEVSQTPTDIDAAITWKSGENIGGFVEVYAGANPQGTMQFRTLQSSDSSLTVVQNANDIDVKVNFADDVLSVFTRTGDVVATAGDYGSTLITNNSTVAGADVTAALDALKTSTDGKLDLAGGTMTGAIGLWQGTPAHSEGLLFYDSTDHTLAYYNDETEMTVNVSQEVILRVRNNTGGALADGDAVYVTGTVGNRPAIAKAIATSETTSRVVGVVTAPIGNNEDGYVTCYGGVASIDTSTWTEGEFLFLSDSVAGGLTNVAPSPWAVQVAIVLIAAVNGRIFVWPARSGIAESLLDVHIPTVGDHGDVTLATVQESDTLVYVTGTWVNQPMNSDIVANKSTVLGVRTTDALNSLSSNIGIVSSNLDAHETDTANPHTTTMANLDDTTITTPAAGDLLVYDGSKWVNATTFEKFTGVLGLVTPLALAASTPYVEIVPVGYQVITSNITYGAGTGRFTIDYSGAPDQPTGGLDVMLNFSLSATMVTANTQFEASFAKNGLPVASADYLRVLLSNSGNQTAGIILSGSLLVPHDAVDTDSYSVIYKSNEAVTLEAFTWSVSGEPFVPVTT